MKQSILQRLISAFFSMKGMTVGLILFLVGIGAATFIESIYGIQSAKIIIYNATWFELLLLYLTLNLISNIFKYKMFAREKIAMLTFHLSFIVILIGAGVTRYISFEGLMVIKEGTSSDFIFTSDPYLLIYLENPKTKATKIEANKRYLSEITDNHFLDELTIGNKNISVEYVDFQSKMVDSLVVNQKFKTSALELVTDGMQSNYLCENDLFMVGNVPLTFNKKLDTPGIEARTVGDSVQMRTLLPVRYLPMSEMQKARQSGMPVSDSLFKTVPVNKWVTFKTKTLYQVGNQQVVFKQKLNHAKKMLVSSGSKKEGSDYLTVKVSDGKATKFVRLEGGMGAIPTPVRFDLNGITCQLEYGSIRKPVPFAIACRDFKLDKYPGSESPSSFASELTILDEEMKYKRDQRVFMNNVMDYRGYRFFQSSYNLDDPSTPDNEEGTKLSVNHDWWGTNITYVGYLLMAIAMILSLFAPVGRFQFLNERLAILKEKRKELFFFLALISVNFTVNAQHNHSETDGKHNHPSKGIYHVVSKEHSEELATLLVLDYDGRVVPFHTLSDQLLRKIYRDNIYKNYNAVQMILSMHMYPQYWMQQKIVQVPSVLREPLKLKDYASAIDLIDANGNFKWLKEYKIAHQKFESKRSEFDKKLIKLNEKFEVVQGVFSWQYLRIIPKKNDPNNQWFIPMSTELLISDTTASITAFNYLNAVALGANKKNFSEANKILKELISMQRNVGKAVVPTERNVKIEISYNKMEIFKNSYRLYGLLGVIMLILFFILIFLNPTSNTSKTINKVRKFLVFCIIITFIYHGVGLSFRWMISGHAPWSNGYEAIIFIAWVTMIAGFLFSRKNAVVVAGAAILASLMIFVSEMNLLDPEITPLVPVLKSYWLMIHVAIITGSYGFLGLACILGLFNLFLYVFRTTKKGEIVTININEITYISEMTMTIGLFMLTIGTFLGGVWANESWGRYWGWDPKETWALVSVLVYAVILHLRFIPGLKGKFLFNAVSFWGYSAILFTFFGVNFMLVGLHSYAQGDGLGKFPTWLIYTIFAFVGLTLIAVWRSNVYNKAVKSNLNN
ncbi:MAG: hypothetical protein EBQ94_01975 [Flavobacteriales bacterium]|nr:hypothetical protein [Flavobacteriales bacterium]